MECLLLQFDEGEVTFDGKVSEDALKSFVSIQSLPLVVEFNHETATKIFGGDIKSHLLLFFSKKEGHFDAHLDNAKNVAKNFREKVKKYSYKFLQNTFASFSLICVIH